MTAMPSLLLPLRSQLPVDRFILVGDGIHNFTDGLMLAARLAVDPHLGWVMKLGIIAHEIPQETGDFVLRLASDWGRTKAFFWIHGCRHRPGSGRHGRSSLIPR
jgi:zinc transporter ZupT